MALQFIIDNNALLLNCKQATLADGYMWCVCLSSQRREKPSRHQFLKSLLQSLRKPSEL